MQPTIATTHFSVFCKFEFDFAKQMLCAILWKHSKFEFLRPSLYYLSDSEKAEQVALSYSNALFFSEIVVTSRRSEQPMSPAF
jgi:hypothetical protein